MCLAGAGFLGYYRKPHFPAPEKSEVQILAGEYEGCGSILKTKNNGVIIVSAAHLLRYWDDNSTAVFSDGSAVRGELLSVDEKTDIGFIFLKGNIPGDFSATVSAYFLREGEPVYLQDGKKNIHEGSILKKDAGIEKLGEGLLSILCRTEHGMSGCGVYTEDGKYAGMLIGGTDDGYGAAVPADQIYQNYEKLLKIK